MEDRRMSGRVGGGTLLLLGLVLVLPGCQPSTASPRDSGAVLPTEASAVAAAADEEPLQVEYRLVSLSPTCVGNHRLRVDADGGVYHAVNQESCPDRATPWSAPYPTAPSRTLDAAQRSRLVRLVRGGFFDLQPSYANSLASGGFYEEIELSLGARRHRVQVRNTERPAAFDALRRALLDLAP